MTEAAGTVILWLEDDTALQAAAVGGKFSSLAELRKDGFAVPPAFAVTTAAFERFMAASGLESLAREVLIDLDRNDLAAVEAASSRMHEEIEAKPLSDEVAAQIAEAYAQLCADADEANVPVAVRSSGVAEDLAGASFAGQYDTYLWVQGAEAVLQHIRMCWMGIFGAQVLTYHPDPDTPYATSGMAVVVQKMVDAQAAGVMFTIDPVTGDPSKIVIESAWGLGEAVVSGDVTPDRFRLDKVTLEVIERAIGDKAVEFRFNPASGIGLVPVEAERQSRASLDDDLVIQLATLGKGLERHRGAAQDIEWAVDRSGRLHLLQARPETIWSQRGRSSILGGQTSAISMVLGSFGVGRTSSTKADD